MVDFQPNNQNKTLPNPKDWLHSKYLGDHEHGLKQLFKEPRWRRANV